MAAQRLLNSSEIRDLRARQFDVDSKIFAHERIVESGQWNQVKMATWNLPIPTRGLFVNDDAHYGDVLIVPDVAGVLHFSGWIDAGDIRGAQVELPPFESPSGNTFQQMLADALKGVAGVGLLVLAGFIVFRLAEKYDYV